MLVVAGEDGQVQLPAEGFAVADHPLYGAAVLRLLPTTSREGVADLELPDLYICSAVVPADSAKGWSYAFRAAKAIDASKRHRTAVADRRDIAPLYPDFGLYVSPNRYPTDTAMPVYARGGDGRVWFGQGGLVAARQRPEPWVLEPYQGFVGSVTVAVPESLVVPKSLRLFLGDRERGVTWPVEVGETVCLPGGDYTVFSRDPYVGDAMGEVAKVQIGPGSQSAVVELGLNTSLGCVKLKTRFAPGTTETPVYIGANVGEQAYFWAGQDPAREEYTLWLPPGQHTLVLKCQDMADKEEEVVVKPGEVSRYYVEVGA